MLEFNVRRFFIPTLLIGLAAAAAATHRPGRNFPPRLAERANVAALTFDYIIVGAGPAGCEYIRERFTHNSRQQLTN